MANSCSSATPVISTGNTRGDSSAAATASRPGNRWRTTAKAAGTPSSSAPSVAPTASRQLKPSEAWKSASCNTLAYQARVKPRGGNTTYGVSLIEIATVTSRGARMNTITAAVTGKSSHAIGPLRRLFMLRVPSCAN